MTETERDHLLMKDSLLRVPEAATYLGLSRAKVYEMVRTGELKSAKLGPGPKAARRIPRRELERYVEQGLAAAEAMRAGESLVAAVA